MTNNEIGELHVSSELVMICKSCERSALWQLFTPRVVGIQTLGVKRSQVRILSARLVLELLNLRIVVSMSAQVSR
jgi:hypothetical protein